MKKEVKFLLGLMTVVAGVFIVKRLKDVKSCDVEDLESDSSNADVQELDEDDICYDIEEDLDFSSCENDDEECIIEDNFAQVCGVTREFAIDEIMSKSDDYSYDTLTDLSDNNLAEVYAKAMGY